MKKLLLVLFISLLAIPNYAQYSMDFGVNLGGANYLGEIGGDQQAQDFLLDLKIQQTNMAFGGYFRYSFTDRISAKISLNYLRIEGADSLSENPVRYGRNLSFRTDMFEASLTGEFAFLVMNDLNRRSRQRVDFRSYAFAGAGILMYYPYAQYNDKWYYLRPLMTEGTENAYDEMTIAVPLGLGANFTFNKQFRVGLEIGYRFTMTDYLDDVSTDYAADTELPFEESKLFAQRSDEVYARGVLLDGMPDATYYGFNEALGKGAIRGNPDTNDGYLTLHVSFAYVISNNSAFGRARYQSFIKRRRKRRKF